VFQSSSSSRKYCTKKNPFTWTSKYYKVEVELQGYWGQHRRRGFVLGYVTYKDGMLVLLAF